MIAYCSVWEQLYFFLTYLCFGSRLYMRLVAKLSLVICGTFSHTRTISMGSEILACLFKSWTTSHRMQGDSDNMARKGLLYHALHGSLGNYTWGWWELLQGSLSAAPHSLAFPLSYWTWYILFIIIYVFICICTCIWFGRYHTPLWDWVWQTFYCGVLTSEDPNKCWLECIPRWPFPPAAYNWPVLLHHGLAKKKSCAAPW